MKQLTGTQRNLLNVINRYGPIQLGGNSANIGVTANKLYCSKSSLDSLKRNEYVAIQDGYYSVSEKGIARINNVTLRPTN